MKPNSVYLSYRAVSGCLVGGVKESSSSRFQTVSDAMVRASSIQEVNGKRNVHIVILPSRKHPEIFRHCGDTATAIGCRCPGCGKVLDVVDAKCADAPDWPDNGCQAIHL